MISFILEVFDYVFKFKLDWVAPLVADRPRVSEPFEKSIYIELPTLHDCSFWTNHEKFTILLDVRIKNKKRNK